MTLLVSVKRVSEKRIFSSLALFRIFFLPGCENIYIKLVNRNEKREKRGGIQVS